MFKRNNSSSQLLSTLCRTAVETPRKVDVVLLKGKTIFATAHLVQSLKCIVLCIHNSLTSSCLLAAIKVISCVEMPWWVLPGQQNTDSSRTPARTPGNLSLLNIILRFKSHVLIKILYSLDFADYILLLCVFYLNIEAALTTLLPSEG